MIDENLLKENVSYACDTDGSEEAEKWKQWFLRVIDAEAIRQNSSSRNCPKCGELMIVGYKRGDSNKYYCCPMCGHEVQEDYR